jgi:hypothetical protein
MELFAPFWNLICSDFRFESNRAMFVLSNLEDEANYGDPLALDLRGEALDWLE